MRFKAWDNKGSEISGKEAIQKRPELFSNEGLVTNVRSHPSQAFFGEHSVQGGCEITSKTEQNNNFISVPV